MTPEQQTILDQALSQLNQLDIDKALVLFYKLLSQRPADLELIERIYKIQIRDPKAQPFNRLANHIFSLNDMSDKFHQLILKTYSEFKTRNPNSHIDSLTDVQTFNLSYHLGLARIPTNIDQLIHRIKSDFSEHPDTPRSLLTYAEHLITKKLYAQAKAELEFLMIYYTEAATQQPAEKLLRKVIEQ